MLSIFVYLVSSSPTRTYDKIKHVCVITCMSGNIIIHTIYIYIYIASSSRGNRLKSLCNASSIRTRDRSWRVAHAIDAAEWVQGVFKVAHAGVPGDDDAGEAAAGRVQAQAQEDAHRLVLRDCEQVREHVAEAGRARGLGRRRRRCRRRWPCLGLVSRSREHERRGGEEQGGWKGSWGLGRRHCWLLWMLKPATRRVTDRSCRVFIGRPIVNQLNMRTKSNRRVFALAVVRTGGTVEINPTTRGAAAVVLASLPAGTPQACRASFPPMERAPMDIRARTAGLRMSVEEKNIQTAARVDVRCKSYSCTPSRVADCRHSCFEFWAMCNLTTKWMEVS
jgi:hypothetical protein